MAADRTEHVLLETYDTESLEARWDEPDSPAKALVLCHPHPQQDGTMTAPLMKGLTTHLVRAGFAVLRFNFRGVGQSTGSWAGGINEVHDVDAAMDHATDRAAERGLPLSLAGWSFGAAISLRWQAVNQSEVTWVGIAPPVPPDTDFPMPGTGDLAPAARTIIIGERDQLIDVEHARAYAELIDAQFHVLPGSDHFFVFREARLSELVIPALA